MKSLIPCALILASVFAIASCKKSSVQKPDNSPPTVNADWKIVSDSITIGGKLTFAYQGVSTDYFNFAPDGKMYMHEGKWGLDTAEYTVVADTAITFMKMYKGVELPWGDMGDPWKVSGLTDHKMVISSWIAIPGAGAEVETFRLSR
ncbi:MAG: hypothetical protein JST32_00995 [Bacteroidetes bacterium]|nr:hypothetical protein [Bacteroidota bacterium]